MILLIETFSRNELHQIQKMKIRLRLPTVLLAFIVLWLAGSCAVIAQLQTSSSGVTALTRVTASHPLANGIELNSGTAVMRITALRDDVIRVRVGPHGQLPEDASWAVLPQARASNVAVTPDQDGKSVGFRTKLLVVRVECATMHLRITDLDGTVIEEDAADRPIEYHGNGFRIYKSMPSDEHYFGLGDKPGTLDRRGNAFSMWNTDAYAFQESADQIYKAIPFFLTLRQGKAAGTLLDNNWRTSFDFGKESHVAYAFGAEDGPLDYYILYGPDAKHVLSTYIWLTGPAPLPPLWSLGFQQSRFSYFPESKVREIADRLRKDNIPSDAIYLDIDYQDHYRPFTVDNVRFPHFAQMIDDLRKQNFHIVAITDLHIANLPDANYIPYDSGVAGDHFVKKPDGTTYVGRVWPGPAVFPDFTRQSTRAWWGTLYASFAQMGIAGFWNDMNEPSIFDSPTKTMPEDVQHRIDEAGFQKRIATHSEIHNIFGLENSRATYEGLLKLSPNRRPFVLTRATYAGGQRYAATWTGDNSSTWNHLRLSTPMLLNLGLSGLGMSGADVGGFIGTPQPDLLTRWIELASFQPIDRDHTNDHSADQEVWVNGPQQEDIRRHYIEERYRLMPYLYTAAEEMSRTGTPIVRPLFLEFPKATPDLHPLDLDADGEFLFGPDLLVAPSPFPDLLDSYEAQLPSATWFNYWTGEKLAPPALTASSAAAQSTGSAPFRVKIQPRLDTLPVFVREGSIIPVQPLIQSTNETPKGPMTLRIYPGRDCKGSLYLDDGYSFSFQHGDYLRMEFTCVQEDNVLTIHIGQHEGQYAPWWKDLQLDVYGSAVPPERALANRNRELKPTFDKAHGIATVILPDDPKGSDLRIEWAK
jgi:alpha-glucosidase